MTMILVQFKKPIYHGNDGSGGEQSADKNANADEQSATEDKNASARGQSPGDMEGL
jgi:hypothetical protein